MWTAQPREAIARRSALTSRRKSGASILNERLIDMKMKGREEGSARSLSYTARSARAFTRRSSRLKMSPTTTHFP